ncbi:hypothetical protein SDC9_25034 [bioreactor metagenome]|uniref:Uncharacterized protein n=1 Tax=bioreactor metagenome TaxID=1076179 RepID=A0A644UK12_9ZZZZ
MQAEPSEQVPILPRRRIAGGQQLVAHEDRICARKEAERLQLVAHLRAPGRQPHDRGRHQDAGQRHDPHQREGIDRPCAALHRNALDLVPQVHRHAVGVRRQGGQRHQQGDAVFLGLSHAEDAAAADLDAASAHLLDGLEAILHRPRAGDPRVVGGRGVDVVVVEVEPRRLQSRDLTGREHAQRHAGLEPQIGHAPHHVAEPVHVAVLGAAPGGPHAEALRAGGLGAPGGGQNLLRRHQFRRLHPGVVMGGLCAIAAIFGAAAGLDAEQARGFDRVGVEMRAVQGLGAMHEVGEGQGVDRPGLRHRPVGADHCAWGRTRAMAAMRPEAKANLTRSPSRKGVRPAASSPCAGT